MKRERISIGRIAVAVLCGILMTASFLPQAQAENGASSTGEVPVGFVYWEDGFLVMTYSAMEVCASPEPPTLPGHIVEPRNGTRIQRAHTTVPVTVYEIPDIDQLRIDLIFGWLLSNCDTEPYASGMGMLRSSFRFDASGVLHSRNGLNAKLQGATGDTVHVHTFARVKIDAATGGLLSLDELRARVR